MDDYVKEAVAKLSETHHLPPSIAKRLVDDDGQVDNDRLQLVLDSVAWGKSPAASGDPGLLRALSDSYYAAQDRGDRIAMLSIIKAITVKLRAELLPRKDRLC